jgi:hypothetical protein
LDGFLASGVRHWFRSRSCFLWDYESKWQYVRKSWAIQVGFRTHYVSTTLGLVGWCVREGEQDMHR